MTEPELPGLGPLARHDQDTVFEEPWQAQTLALAFNLVERGQFSAVQWSQALGAELVRAREHGDPDDATTYYRAVLTALETLLDAQKSLTSHLLDERTQAWREAYLRTPHGQPVQLTE